LPARPEAAGRARHALDSLQGAFGDDALDALRLLVSEVVTNSIRHAGLGPDDEITLTVAPAQRAVRVEVLDRGRGFDPARVPAPTSHQLGGWGLYLVGKLADRWGVSNEGATRVWFEIDDPTR
jgi:anti-sigma regulatory factor (Ser/Thr protein kinase)